MPPFGYDNIFPLENASEIGYTIVGYAIGHSSLWINLKDKTEGFSGCLYFADVQYLSAPMYWVSADFKLAPVSECEQLLVRMKGYPEQLAKLWEARVKKENLVKNCNLYKVEKPDLMIEILAGNVELLNDNILSSRLHKRK